MRAHVGKRIRLAMLTALTALTLDVAVGPTAAAKSASSEDPLSLVALLIQDGNLNRAEAVLDRISPAVDGDLDTGRYWTLQGLVSLRQGDPAQAADALTRALDLVEGEPDPQLVLSLARARVLSGDSARPWRPWRGVGRSSTPSRRPTSSRRGRTETSPSRGRRGPGWSGARSASPARWTSCGSRCCCWWRWA